MTIGDVIKKSILPLAFMVFWFWMTKTIMKVSGQTDWFWWVFIAGLPFGIHKMRLILIPRGMDTTATLGMAALSVIIGALIGSIMIPVYVIRAIYVFIRYIIGKIMNSLIRGRLAKTKIVSSASFFVPKIRQFRGNPFCKYIYLEDSNMRERIESKHVTKEIKSQMPVIPVEIVKERGCTFCPYYLGNYEKQPRCMMKTCAWDDENERFHPVLRGLIPFYKEKMEKAEVKFLAMKKIYTTLLGMFADEMKQEELEKDECYGCAYGKCGPCVGICYKSMKA